MNIFTIAFYFFLSSLFLRFFSIFDFFLWSLAFVLLCFYLQTRWIYKAVIICFFLRVIIGVDFSGLQGGNTYDLLLEGSDSKTQIIKSKGKLIREKAYLQYYLPDGLYTSSVELTDKVVSRGREYYHGKVYSEIRTGERFFREVARDKVSLLLHGRGVEFQNFYRSAILGEKSQVEEDQKKLFQRTGTSHLLVISGLHIGIITTLGFFLLGLFPISHDLKYYLTIGFLTLYVAILTPTPSVVRAYFMGLFILLGGLLYENTNPKKSVAASMVLLLLFYPLSGSSVSFLLSYGAVFSIIFLFPLLKAIINKRLKVSNPFVNLIILTFTIQCFLSPLTLLLFRSFNIFNFIINILAIPLATIIIQLAFMAFLLEFLTLGSIFIPAVELLYYLLIIILKFWDSLALPSLTYYGRGNYTYLFFLYLGLFLVIYTQKKRYLIITLLTLIISNLPVTKNQPISENSYFYLTDNKAKILLANDEFNSFLENDLYNSGVRKLDYLVTNIVPDLSESNFRVAEVILLELGDTQKIGNFIITNNNGVIEALQN